MDRRFNNVPIISLKLEKYNLRPDFQRGFVWRESQQIKLMDSIIKGYDITPLYTWVNDPNSDLHSIIDGQQRLTTIFRFIDGQFTLNGHKCPDIMNTEHEGANYGVLPDRLRDRINSYTLNFVEVTAERGEVEEMFQRMQMGTKLKPVEIRNARGGKLRDFIKSANDAPFLNVFRLNTNRLQHDEVLHHICILETNDLKAVSLKNNDLQKFFLDYSFEGIGEEREEAIRDTLEFLSTDIPEMKETIRRINALPMYVIARFNKDKITPAEFWKWALSFLSRNRMPGSAYKGACSTGSAEKAKVAERIRLMAKDFDKEVLVKHEEQVS